MCDHCTTAAGPAGAQLRRRFATGHDYEMRKSNSSAICLALTLGLGLLLVTIATFVYSFGAHHAREAEGPKYMQGGPVPGEVFHALVEAPSLKLLADFSTWTLRDKARQLDAIDCGHTNVDWCPEYLWIEDREGPGEWLRTSDQVRLASHAGAFTYVRHRDIEAKVLQGASGELEQALASAKFAVQQAHLVLRQGMPLRVIGMGDDGPQEEPRERPLRERG